MSRNLGIDHCRMCPGGHKDIALEEEPRPITADDCGKHFVVEFGGLLVAKAHCRICHALYLAWVDWPKMRWRKPNDQRFVDLSFRNSFDDEPSLEDLPLFVVKIAYRRRPAPIIEHYDVRDSAQRDAWIKRQEIEIAKNLMIKDEP
jgi:hypothetical protein